MLQIVGIKKNDIIVTSGGVNDGDTPGKAYNPDDVSYAPDRFIWDVY